MLATDERVHAFIGGARSKKTHTACYLAFRWWGLMGGRGRTGWMMGPELDRAFLLVEKWALGEDGTPPICPPELMLRWPTSLIELRTRPTIEMIDGFTWTARHCGRQGRNLTARNVVIVLWTESATTASPMDFNRARGRIVQSKGRMALDAVPEARNWVRSSIIEAAATEADEIEKARERGEPAARRTYRLQTLSIEGNQWVDLEEATAFRRDLERIDPNMARREAGGEFVDDHEALFDYDPSVHTFESLEREEPASALDRLGFVDITWTASLRWFSRSHHWIIGVDINKDPHTALMMKIAVMKKRDPTAPLNWHAFFFDCRQVWGKDSEQAARDLSEHRDGMYNGAAIVIDATSGNKRSNAGGGLNQRLNIIPPEAYERAGFEVRGAERQKHDRRKYANPGVVDGTLVCRRLMRERRSHLDRQRCGPFGNALRNQTAEPDGVTPYKKSNTNQDRYIGAFTDVFRMVTWPFFSLKPHEESGEPLAIKVHG